MEDDSLFGCRARMGSGRPKAVLLLVNLRSPNERDTSTQTLRAKMRCQEGNSPDRLLRSQNVCEVEGRKKVLPFRRWAWRQPFFKESVIAHWISFIRRKCTGINKLPKQRIFSFLVLAKKRIGGSRTFCMRVKVFCKKCWTYQK